MRTVVRLPGIHKRAIDFEFCRHTEPKALGLTDRRTTWTNPGLFRQGRLKLLAASRRVVKLSEESRRFRLR